MSDPQKRFMAINLSGIAAGSIDRNMMARELWNAVTTIADEVPPATEGEVFITIAFRRRGGH